MSTTTTTPTCTSCIDPSARCSTRIPGDRVSIGELHHPDFDRWAEYYGERQDEIHVPFNFHVINSPWRADAVRRAVEGVQGALPAGAWASWVLGNHDQPRFASPERAGRDQAKVGMLLLLTLRGTPTIYYGEEIGMIDVPVAAADARDPLERREPGRGRDPERSPMQWDASPNAGFTAPGIEPWLPVSHRTPPTSTSPARRRIPTRSSR